MRTTTATIRLVLRTTKTLSDGTNPIMIRVCWKGMREMSTHYSCLPKYWDAKNECIKKSFPNASQINATLLKLKNDTITRKLEFEASGKPYTASDLLQKEPTTRSSGTDRSTMGETVIKEPRLGLENLLNRYALDSGLALQTIRRRKASLTVMKRVLGHVPKLDELSPELVMKLEQAMRDEGLGEGYIQGTVGVLKSLCYYAEDNGLIAENPLRKLKRRKKVRKVIKENPKHIGMVALRNLRHEVFEFMREDDSICTDRHHRYAALYFFALTVSFQGLAPIDMLTLPRTALRLEHNTSMDFLCADVYRRKTGVPVKIRIPYTAHNEKLIKPLLELDGYYLLPYLGKEKIDSEVELLKAMNTVLRMLRWNWKKHCVPYMNARLAPSLRIPEDLTLYSARHTYAFEFSIQSGNLTALATLMGRSVDGISTYVNMLGGDKELRYITTQALKSEISQNRDSHDSRLDLDSISKDD